MGFIKIDRKILNWRWYTDVPVKVLWIHILLKANWNESAFMDKEIPKGTFPTSISHLMIETGLSEKQVRGALKKLEKTHEISTQKTNKYTLITVNKWDEYQGNVDDEGTQEGNLEGTQEETQRATIEEYKNRRNQEINNMNVGGQKPFVKPTIEEITSYCIEMGYDSIEPQKFYNYYDDPKRNWSVKSKKGGRKKMSNWKLALNSWVVNEIRFNETNDLKNKAREAYIKDVEMKSQKGGLFFFDDTD